MNRKSLLDLAMELEPEPSCSECGGPEPLDNGRCQECQDNDFCGDCGIELTKENSWSDITCQQCAKLLGLDKPMPALEFKKVFEERTFTIQDGKATFKGAWQLNKILKALHDEGLLYKVER